MRRVYAPYARRETWVVGGQESQEKTVDWWRALAMAQDLRQKTHHIQSRNTLTAAETTQHEENVPKMLLNLITS